MELLVVLSVSAHTKSDVDLRTPYCMFSQTPQLLLYIPDPSLSQGSTEIIRITQK